MRIPALALAFLVVSGPVRSQPTMTVWVDDAGTLVSDYDIQTALAFTVVVTLDSDGQDVAYAEWKIDDLVGKLGLAKLGVTIPLGNCGLIPENCFQGEYRIFIDGCAEPGARLELARLQFVDLTGLGILDEVVQIGPLPAGSLPSGPGFVDCQDNPVTAPMGGTPGGQTSSGVVFPPGSLILNPTRPLPPDAGSFGTLKTRY